jgi:hypothetical protein
MTRQNCAHASCQCEVEAAFGRYCSEACATKAGDRSKREEPCSCGHPHCH